jgi:hypothetical protein
MRSEAPIVYKALRLASVVMLVAVVALAASVGYSVFQEYKILGSVLSGGGGNQQNNNMNGSQISQSLNGNQLSLSPLTIPNNMTYPLGIQVGGAAYLAGVKVSTFESPLEMIMPGQIGHVQVTASLNLSSVLQNATALQVMFLQPSNLVTAFSIYAGIDPVAGLNITNHSNSTIGAILGNFSVAAGTPTTNGTGYTFPLQISWNNGSPLQLPANVQAVMTQMPGQPTGNYGTASGNFNVTQGNNEQTLYFYVPALEMNPQSFHGQYNFEVTISAYGASVTFPESVSY